MPDWAIVIGVDNYTRAGHMNLKGAVRDAIAMATYLTTGPQPLVQPSRVKLLLSPTADSPKPPDILPALPADRPHIVDAFKDIVTKPGPARLFVHFSGHGLMAPGLTGGEALLPADFDPGDPVFSIRLEGILQFLRTSRFNQQFFFIDACRNTPLDGNFNIGQFPVTPDPGQMHPEVQQYVYCATARGVTAAEITRANDERGVFTPPLIEGLSGGGTAKVFDQDDDVYNVTTGRLLHFVADRVRRTIKMFADVDAVAALQEPRLIGEIGETERTIVTIPAASVRPVTLTFECIPADAATLATVTVQSAGEDDRAEGPPITNSTALNLPPRTYLVVAKASGFIAKKKSQFTDVYDNVCLKLEFEPAPRDAPVRRGAVSTIAPPASLEVWSTDPLAVVRIVDAKGRTIAARRETVVVTDIKPGLYRGQVIAADGRQSEELVAVERGDEESVRIIAPEQPPLLVRSAVASRRRLSEAVEVRSVSDTPDVSLEAQAPLGAKQAFVSLPFDESCRAVIAVPALDDRLSLLLIDQTKAQAMSSALLVVRRANPVLADQARTEVAQRYYQSGLFACAASVAEAATDDPVAWLIEAYSLLRLAFMAKPAEQQDRNTTRWTQRIAELRDRVSRLIDNCGELSDPHLLQAEIAVLKGADAPDAADCRRALDCGLPVCAFGFELLSAYVFSHKIEHPNAGLLAMVAARHRLPSSPWTAWIEPR